MKSIAINNFRGFDGSEIRIGKVNLLIGENSSGKSSLIRFFMMLDQGFFMNSDFESLISLDGPFFDFGNYTNIVYNGKPESRIEFTIQTDDTHRQTVRDNLFEEYSTVKAWNDFLAEPGNEVAKFINSTVKMHYVMPKGFGLRQHYEMTFTCPEIGMVKLERVSTDSPDDTAYFSDKAELSVEIGKFKKKGIVGVSFAGVFPLVEPDDVKKICKGSSKGLFQKIAFLLMSQNTIISFIKSSRYINGLKTEINRMSMVRGGVEFNTKTTSGDIAKDILAIKRDKYAFSVMNKIVSDLGIGEAVDVQVSKDFPVSEVVVKKNGKWRNIYDLGYGTGLLLPVISHLAKSNRRRSNLFIEQPEMHLHPALQCKLLDAIIANRGNNTVFIETHSEYFIRKLQLAVKSKALRSQDISIQYFSAPKGKFEISEHLIKENGLLDKPLPRTFFGNTYDLAKGLI